MGSWRSYQLYWQRRRSCSHLCSRHWPCLLSRGCVHTRREQIQNDGTPMRYALFTACWIAFVGLPGWMSLAWMRECRPGVTFSLAMGVCAFGAWTVGTLALSKAPRRIKLAIGSCALSLLLFAVIVDIGHRRWAPGAAGLVQMLTRLP